METAELKEKASHFLTDMMALMGFDATVTLMETENDQEIKFSIACENASRLIGRHGQTLEATELLLNRMLRKFSEELPWITLDVDGYTTGAHHSGGHKDSRQDSEMWERFTSLATEAAKEVKYWKKGKRLGPYSPAERRAIHTAIKGIPGIKSESEPAPLFGERMKYVHILLDEETEG